MNIRRSAGLLLALTPAALVAQSPRQQPDRVLYDNGIKDIQHHRYERARLTLQTLLSTYDSSEFRAPAMLAVADSWYREGGAHGWTQAEAQCQTLLSQFPDTPSAAEARQLMHKIEEARAKAK